MDESLKDSFIAFERSGQIWTALSDGTKQRQLTNGNVESSGAKDDSSPSVSPDGKTVVYQHWEIIPGLKTPDNEPVGAAALYSVPSTGGDPVRLSPAAWLTETGWTPLLPTDPPPPLWMRSASKYARDCTEPSFSPDGKSICFIIHDYLDRGQVEFEAISTMNSDGAGEQQILYRTWSAGEEGELIYTPRFSPDGSSIYFTKGGEIVEVPVKGGKLKRVGGSKGVQAYRGYSISNSLDLIAMVQPVQPYDRHTGDRIVVMALDDGTTRTAYTPPPDQEESQSQPGIGDNLSFSPSGKTIVFSGTYPRRGGILLVSAGGGKPKEIIKMGNNPCFGRLASK